VACAVQRGEEDKAQSVSTFQLRVRFVHQNKKIEEGEN